MTQSIFSAFLVLTVYMQQVDYQRVDKYLSSHWNVDEAYFDSLLRKDRNSAYLIGMKYYFCAERIGFENARMALEAEVGKNEISGPFIDLALARISRGLGDTILAKELIEMALSKDRVNKWCLYEKYLLLKDDADNASQVLDKLFEIEPLFPRGVIEKAYTLEPSLNCQEIIVLLNGLPESMRYADTDSYLGDAFYFCDNPSSAEILYKSSVQKGENAPAFYGLGNIELYVKNRLMQAKHYYTKALEADERYQPAYLGLGWVNYEEACFLKAESNFMQALEIEKNDAALQELILFYLKIKQFDKARSFIEMFEGIFGYSYVSEGYMLVIDLHNSPDDKKDHIIEAYNRKFGKEAVRWSSKLFFELRE